MSVLNYIVWSVSPEIIHTEFFTLRWYGLLFAFAFILGFKILNRIYKNEGRKEKNLDTLTQYIIFATIIGARLGHCLFYEPGHFLSHPLEILKVWQGGLASHGAAIGILIAVYFYSKKYPNDSYLWVMDRLVIVIALGGSLIRLGNLMNSEIIGKPTNLPWGFVFKSVDSIPRHPAQIYESIAYFLLFLFLLSLYSRWKGNVYQGILFGYFLTITFSLRFLFEFLKENQVSFENEMILNLGQWLSLPLIIAGIYFVFNSIRVKKIPTTK